MSAALDHWAGADRGVVAGDRPAGAAIPEPDGRATQPELFAGRQNVSPRRLVDPGPSPAQLQALFEAAAAAPDHGRLVPYRFIVVPPSKRYLLAAAFGLALVDRAPDATLEQIEAARSKAYRSPLLLLAATDASDCGTDGIPALEKIVATGCAIQNLLLAAHAAGFGSGLTSGRAMNAVRLRELFALKGHEQAVCFVNIGTVVAPRPLRVRPQPSSFVSEL